MIIIQNIKNTTRYGNGVVVTKNEKALLRQINHDLKLARLQGRKYEKAFVKRTNNFLAAKRLDEKVYMTSSSEPEYAMNGVFLDGCSFDNCSIDKYVKYHSSNSLLLFKNIGSYFCPKCGKLESFHDVIGELECCGLKQVYVNISTKNNDTLIFNKMESFKQLSLTQELEEVNIDKASAFLLNTSKEDFYIVEKRKDVKFAKNGYILHLDGQSTGITVEKANIGAIIYIDSVSKKTESFKKGEITLENIKLFSKECILESWSWDSQLKPVMNFLDKYNLEVEVTMDMMAAIINYSAAIKDRFEEVTSESERISILKSLDGKSSLSTKAILAGFEGVADDIDAMEYIKIITSGVILPETDDYAEKLSMQSFFKDDVDLFAELSKENIYHRYGDVYSKVNARWFLAGVREFPRVQRIYAAFAKHNAHLGFAAQEISEKEFKTIVKTMLKDEDNLDIESLNVPSMDRVTHKLYALGGFKFAIDYIATYGAREYDLLTRVTSKLNSNESYEQNIAHYNNFFDMIKEDKSKLYALAHINEYHYHYSLQLRVISTEEGREAYAESIKLLYSNDKKVSFLKDFLELKEEAEDIYPTLRGRKVNYSRLVLEHDYYLQMVRNSKRDLTSIFKHRYELFKPFRMSVGNEKYVVEAPREINDLVKEGTELSHCVDTYGTVLEAGQEMVLFVRTQRGVPLYTISLDENGNVCQSSGKAHSAVPSEVLMNLQRTIATDKSKFEAVQNFFVN